MFGVFDGHLGDAASDFAARSIRERFLHHAFLGSKAGTTSFNLSSVVESLPWLEAALREAISNIDTTFVSEAATSGIKSGSTACVALRVGDRLLVANVGDSKALFCSSCEGGKQSSNEHLTGLDHKGVLKSSRRARYRMSRMSRDATPHPHSEGLCVQELTSDHHPNRVEERLRIEASGGFVTSGSSPRVNGQLAVSRSIGDADLRRFGVISEPELSGWVQISENDKFLVLASDGIFEKMSPQEVCNVLHAIGSGQDITAVMGGLEEDNGVVIALPLPGMELPQPQSNHGVQKVAVDFHSTEVSAGYVAAIDACLSEDRSTLIESRSPEDLRGPTGIAQVMAQILVEIAFRAGSMDNLSALIIPLKVLNG